MSQCSNHSGHEQKIINLESKIVSDFNKLEIKMASDFNTIKWLLGIIITINTGFVIALWDLRSDTSICKTKIELYDKVFETKIASIKENKNE